MPAKHKLIFRLFWIPFAAAFLFLLLSTISRSLNNILAYLTEDSYELYLKFETREWLILFLLALAVLIHLVLELFAHFSEKVARSRILTHLRYGPAAVTFLWIGFVPLFDAAMIEFSRQKIRNYVYNGSRSAGEPDLMLLHNNDRGWCGNGASATYEHLYYPTASAGLQDPDPAVRALSFLASAEVRDFLNGSRGFRSDTAAACRDESAFVRNTVDQYLAGSNSSCGKVLSSADLEAFR
jgi:hypothetical protein